MWDYDSLYKKSKYFVRKGLEHQTQEFAEAPLWFILAIELLARATLSRIHPVLLADPQDGANIMSAFGFGRKKAPMSVPAKTVFRRCVVVCEEYSESDFDRCMEWMNWRNEQLHTGKLAFEELKASTWLPDFYRICMIFLSYNATSLQDFLGENHAATAKEIVESLSTKKKSEAHSMVREKRIKFKKFGVDERLERLNAGRIATQQAWSIRRRGKEIDCPSCEGAALVFGDLIRSTDPRDKDGELVQDDYWLPSGLICYCCDLKITGHAYVAALGFGDPFWTQDILDPKEYYEIVFDPSEYFEAEYNNE